VPIHYKCKKGAKKKAKLGENPADLPLEEALNVAQKDLRHGKRINVFV
jgi:hypothetical protein